MFNSHIKTAVARAFTERLTDLSWSIRHADTESIRNQHYYRVDECELLISHLALADLINADDKNQLLERIVALKKTMREK